MKKIIFLFTLLFIFSCSEIVDKPKNLLSKDEMSEVIADFAIYDQSYTVNPTSNLEITSRYVLKKHKITAKDYRDSYKYYISRPNQLDKILKNAKEIILDKDPKLEGYMEKLEKKNPNLPSFVK
ncbi:DUF4296 domain-containing protein [Cloacibacterium sp.]|jgi:hypothetical protein|uniref:DUF4296 domain-containing protein n=1 Tax=Cloacibacterium sp. TaxID=1913682 RepID=UPI0035AE2833